MSIIIHQQAGSAPDAQVPDQVRDGWLAPVISLRPYLYRRAVEEAQALRAMQRPGDGAR